MQPKYMALRATPLTLALVLASACHKSESRKTPAEQPEREHVDPGTSNLISDQDLDLFQVVATPVKGAPLARQVAHAAVIDGKVLIWGGSGTGGDPRFASGAMLDPVANEWKPIADAPLNDTGFLHPVWTGRELIVWDSYARYAEHAGAVYLPDSNSWRLINKEGAPSYRDGAQTLWNGKNMLVLGGNLKDSKDYNREIFSYDPAANLWSRLADAPEHTLGRNFEWSWGMRAGQHLLFWEMDVPPVGKPIQLIPHRLSTETLEWTQAPQDGPQPTFAGLRMSVQDKAFVWGGIVSHPDSGELSRQGFLYDPITNNWSEIPTPEGINPRLQMGAAARDSQVLVFGGCPEANFYSTSCKTPLNDGFIVDTASGTSRKVSDVGAPDPQIMPRIVAMGEGFLVMGQSLPGANVKDAFYYNPGEDSWTTLDLQSALRDRTNHVLISLDANSLLIWGGLDSSGVTNTGAVIRFAPPR